MSCHKDNDNDDDDKDEVVRSDKGDTVSGTNDDDGNDDDDKDEVARSERQCLVPGEEEGVRAPGLDAGREGCQDQR